MSDVNVDIPVISKPEENVAIPATFKLVLMPTVDWNVDLPTTLKVSEILVASNSVFPSTSRLISVVSPTTFNVSEILVASNSVLPSTSRSA